MADRMEAVIAHLQIIHTWADYAREHSLQFFTPKHLEDIAQWSSDALVMIEEQKQMYFTLEHDWRMCRKLLKEQKAVEPKTEPSAKGYWYTCGACGWWLFEVRDTVHFDDRKRIHFCASCGRSVKWE